MNARIDRKTLADIGAGDVAIESVLDGSGFPIIARPFWSQAGMGLVKLETASAIEAYLREWVDAEFYLAPFVDYRSRDGLFRKARIAIIEGRPFVCHMAISQHWMIHYLNADMRNDAAKPASWRISSATSAFGMRSLQDNRGTQRARIPADRLRRDAGWQALGIRKWEPQ